MPKPTKGPRLGGSPSHERIILDNLASQLFEHGRVTTTEAKAKRVRPLAERLITKAKRGDLHAVRMAAKHVRDKDVLYTLFHEIAPTMEGRDGGYTRIIKLAPRKGDNAPMALIEVITDPVQKKDKPATSAPTSADIEKAVAEAEETPEDEVEETTDAEDTASEDTASEDTASEDTASDEATEDADTADEKDADEADEEKADKDA